MIEKMSYMIFFLMTFIWSKITTLIHLTVFILHSNTKYYSDGRNQGIAKGRAKLGCLSKERVSNRKSSSNRVRLTSFPKIVYNKVNNFRLNCFLIKCGQVKTSRWPKPSKTIYVML